MGIAESPMHFDLDARRVRLSVGEFADFTLGPRDPGEGPAGVWRAQLGTHWHQQLRGLAEADDPGAEFEVPIEGTMVESGWVVALTGRIDQLLRRPESWRVREIKTVSRALPDGEAVLRADFPAYFIQLAAYAALLRSGGAPPALRAELVFVETGTGLSQTVELLLEDEFALRAQLRRIADFLDQRLRARDRLRALVIRPPFTELRPGQETVQTELAAATALGRAAVLLEAPTGFGKTGALLQFAVGQLRAGHFDRLLYLTSKATGQLQVVQTLATMAPPSGTGGLAVWAVRPKAEHCVNHAFHCVRDDCVYLDGVESRWAGSGLARFYLFDGHPRDLATLRTAGKEARICPYEITRAALPFNDVWIGDFNYVFAPGSRGLFYHQPGFEPGRSLLIIDEAHNLPARVADAYSHTLLAQEAREVAFRLPEIHPGAELRDAWEAWTLFLERLTPTAALADDDQAEAQRLILAVGAAIRGAPIDYGALTPRATEIIWELPTLAEQLEGDPLPRLWWVRRAGELALTCLDAAPAIGEALGEFGGVILASATPGPPAAFAAACGLDRLAEDRRLAAAEKTTPLSGLENGRLGALTKKATKKLSAQLTSGAALLRAQPEGAALAHIRAATPWREGAYDVAVDLRVDTTFQHRERYYALTADTLAALQRHAPDSSVAIFFPSYAYAEAVLAAAPPGERSRALLQPRSADLAAQAAWVESSLRERAALVLVLGSSFAESIDLFGGRVSHAMVVGPALPEVNPVQRARMAAFEGLGRDGAFQRVYQIPGIQKVNQALGRLVRGPGQRAKVILHCRRFAEPGYAQLLAPDYQKGIRIESAEDLELWLAGRL